MSLEEWRAVSAVNLDGPYFCSKAVVPSMIENGWGRIVNVSGLNAFKGRPGWAHVCASKMGALGLTRALAVELAQYGILVNHVVPGAFDTTRDATQGAAPAPTASAIPVGRLGLPEEAARVCAFLASDEASYVTGQTGPRERRRAGRIAASVPATPDGSSDGPCRRRRKPSRGL